MQEEQERPTQPDKTDRYSATDITIDGKHRSLTCLCSRDSIGPEFPSWPSWHCQSSRVPGSEASVRQPSDEEWATPCTHSASRKRVVYVVDPQAPVLIRFAQAPATWHPTEIPATMLWMGRSGGVLRTTQTVLGFLSSPGAPGRKSLLNHSRRPCRSSPGIGPVMKTMRSRRFAAVTTLSFGRCRQTDRLKGGLTICRSRRASALSVPAGKS